MVSIVANYAAHGALQALQAVNRDLASARDRLSTGLAVSSARDNGAIYAIAQRQTARLTELMAMQAGIDRATSALDVSVAAGTSVLDTLLSMRDAAVAATVEGLSANDRAYLQADFDSLRGRINQMLASAKFDGIDLVQGVGGGFDLMLTAPSNAEVRPPTVTRVSTSSAGAQASGTADTSTDGALQFFAGGTKLLFQSPQTSLPGDSGSMDVFVKDLSTGALTLVSSKPDGSAAGALYKNHYVSSTNGAGVSPDGTKVLFETNHNFVAGDTNSGDRNDLYIKDLATGALTLVTVDPGGGFTPVYQRYKASFSPDGTKVLFESKTPNFVAGDTNGRADIFIKDLSSGVISRVSTTDTGAQLDRDSLNPVFSPDGNKVAFESAATNLPGANGRAQIYIKDLTTGTVTLAVSSNTTWADLGFSFSPDGKSIMYTSATSMAASDGNGFYDVYIKDLTTSAVTHVTTAVGGGSVNSWSGRAVFSPDGKQVAFMQNGSNMVAGDTNGVADVFVEDLTTGSVTRVSVSSTGVQANAASGSQSFAPAFSADGQSIAFYSTASNLVDNDTNGATDVFVATLPPSPNTAISAYDWRIGGGGSLSQISSASGLLSTAASASAVVVAIDNAVKALGQDLSKLAGQAIALERQNASLTRLYDAIDDGLSRLVDTDMTKESARLTALKVKQGLAEKALAVANQSQAFLVSLLEPMAYGGGRGLVFNAFV